MGLSAFYSKMKNRNAFRNEQEMAVA